VAHKTCVVCGQPSTSYRCSRHAVTRHRLTREQRGYDYAHRRTRALLLPGALGTACPICHELMLPGQPLDLARVKLPRVKREIVDPPSAAEVETIIQTVPARWRLRLRVLEQTGMRVGELLALAWGDVDEEGSRFRIKSGKTAAARRWVAVPEWLMAEVAATCPREDRTPERIVFPGANSDRVRIVMARACKTAGIAHYHPHDLSHRYASVKIAEGVSVPKVAAQLGHAKNSMTLDTYSHVLVAD
jgi:integrase